MTDTKRVVIDIADQIAPSLLPSLEKLSKSSREAHSDVIKLQSAMRGFNRISLNSQIKQFERLATSIKKANSSFSQKSSSNARSQIEAERVSQAKAKTELASVRIAEAEAKAAIQAAKLSQESQKTAQQQERTAQATSKTAQEIAKAAQAQQNLETAKARTLQQTNNTLASQQRVQQSILKTNQEAHKESTARANSLTAIQKTKHESEKILFTSAKTQESVARAAKLEQDRAVASARTRQIAEQTLLVEQRRIKVQRQNEMALKGMLAQTRKLSYAVRDVMRVWLFIGAVTFPVVAVAKYADEYVNLNNKLQYVSDNQAHANLLFEELGAIAKRTRSDLDATISSFARFDRALKHTGVEQQRVLKMTETINKAFIVSGTTAQESASAMLQLSQAFNANKLQGDEFRSVAENLPVAMRYFAQELDVPISKLQDVRAEGKITSEVMLKAFERMAAEMDVAFARTTPTIGQAMAHFNTSMVMTIGSAEKTTGALAGVSKGIIWASNNLQTLASVAIFFGGVFVLHVGVRAVAALKGLAIQAITTRAVLTRMWAFIPPHVLGVVGVLATLAMAFTTLGSSARDSAREMKESVETAHMALSRMVEEQLQKHSKDITLTIGLNETALLETEREIKFIERSIVSLEKEAEKFENMTDMARKQLMTTFTPSQKIEQAESRLIDLRYEVVAYRKELERLNAIRGETENAIVDFGIKKENPSHGMEKLEGQSLESALNFSKSVAEAFYENTLASKYEMQWNLGLLKETTEQQYLLNLETAKASDKLIVVGNNARTVKEMLEASVTALKEAGKTEIQIGAMRLENAGATPEEVAEYESNMKLAKTRNELAKGTKENAKTLAIYNQELDNEILRVKLLREERENSAKVDRITEDLAKNKMRISAQEKADLLTKIELIAQLSKVQAEMDVIYDSTTAHIELFNAKVQASNELLKMGVITAQQYANAIAGASIEFQKVGTRLTDQQTLFNLNEMGIDTSQFDMQLGVQREIFSAHLETLNEMQQAGLISVGDFAEARLQLTVKNMENSSNAYLSGFAKAYGQYSQGLTTFSDGVSQATLSVFNNMENALVNFAQTSKFQFKDMTISILKDLSQLLIKMGMVRLMQAAISGMGGYSGGGVVGTPNSASYGDIGGGIPYRYSEGGHTGFGGKFEPAGIVHKNEVVWSQDDVQRWGGTDRVERLRLKGYSGGGVVGGGANIGNDSSKQPVTIIVNIDKDGNADIDIDQADLSKMVFEIVDGRINKWESDQKRNGGALRGRR